MVGATSSTQTRITLAGPELLDRIETGLADVRVITNVAKDKVETTITYIKNGAADHYGKGRNDELLQKSKHALGEAP